MTNSEFSLKTASVAPELLSFAMRFTNNNEDAQDLLQDTLVKAYTYQAQFDHQTNLKAWLYTIMRNTFINNYRRKLKTYALINQRDEISYSELSYSASKNLAEGSLVLKDVRKALNQIPEAYAIPFIRHFEGYKYFEIAEELNMPIGTVKTRIHLARKMLKEYLQSYAKVAYKSGEA
ncbi:MULTISPECIES: sigma-70 family RNA polymerase sigma factor [unclassified Pedobacter]|uniref:sigma-70 family RNA polymerase sigma factor n=1 Tax=unclassified Pedobacter TaxID=2628915 RepID=UPI001E48898F|nr:MULTISPECIES: sigma-70 family RNA polymerase sigma factor [unclassified Pedobacter]